MWCVHIKRGSFQTVNTELYIDWGPGKTFTNPCSFSAVLRRILSPNFSEIAVLCVKKTKQQHQKRNGFELRMCCNLTVLEDQFICPICDKHVKLQKQINEPSILGFKLVLASFACFYCLQIQVLLACEPRLEDEYDVKLFRCSTFTPNPLKPYVTLVWFPPDGQHNQSHNGLRRRANGAAT